MTPFERARGEYAISTDARRIDVDAVHAYLKRSYWAEGIPKELVAKSIAASLSFALIHGERQIGFARVVTDRVTFAYLSDVYVLEEYRGQGLAKWLVTELQTHPELQGLRRWVLVTQDAQGLYGQLGFRPLQHPERYMEIVRANVYKKSAEGA